jgi:hypothetical protein
MGGRVEECSVAPFRNKRVKTLCGCREQRVQTKGKYKLRLTTKAYKLSYNYINYTINLVGRSFASGVAGACVLVAQGGLGGRRLVSGRYQGLFTECKQLEREAHHSHPSNVGVMNGEAASPLRNVFTP